MKTPNTASILISPDLCPIKRVDELCNENNFSKIYNDYIEVLQKVDYRIVNLEAPLTDIKRPIKKTGPNLSVSPKHVEHLKWAKFDLLTLANNHIMDHGEAGLNDTLATLEKNQIDYVGVGADLQSSNRIFYQELNGINIAIINVAENEFTIASLKEAGASPLDIIDNSYQIRQAKSLADHVIVIIHGGNEEYNLPSPRVQKTYRFFIESGADTVISHHTHCFSGYEVYKGKGIFYGLGNFIFDRANSTNQPWNFGFSVELILTKDTINFELHPFKQCNGASVGVFKLSENERIEFLNQIEHLNAVIADSKKLLQNWTNLIAERKRAYLNYLEPFGSIVFRGLRKFGLMPRLINDSKKVLLLNLIRCEAHRELLTGVLEDEYLKKNNS
jgi:hypothetical protein